MSISIKKNR